eukprot:g6260.t1
MQAHMRAFEVEAGKKNDATAEAVARLEIETAELHYDAVMDNTCELEDVIRNCAASFNIKPEELKDEEQEARLGGGEEQDATDETETEANAEEGSGVIDAVPQRESKDDGASFKGDTQMPNACE